MAENHVTLNLDPEGKFDFLIAKTMLQKKLGMELSDTEAVRLLATFYTSQIYDSNYRKQKERPSLNYEKDICPVCKNEFFPSTKAKKTCSPLCRRRLYTKKKLGLLPSGNS